MVPDTTVFTFYCLLLPLHCLTTNTAWVFKLVGAWVDVNVTRQKQQEQAEVGGLT